MSAPRFLRQCRGASRRSPHAHHPSHHEDRSRRARRRARRRRPGAIVGDAAGVRSRGPDGTGGRACQRREGCSASPSGRSRGTSGSAESALDAPALFVGERRNDVRVRNDVRQRQRRRGAPHAARNRAQRRARLRLRQRPEPLDAAPRRHLVHARSHLPSLRRDVLHALVRGREPAGPERDRRPRRDLARARHLARRHLRPRLRLQPELRYLVAPDLRRAFAVVDYATSSMGRTSTGQSPASALRLESPSPTTTIWAPSRAGNRSRAAARAASAVTPAMRVRYASRWFSPTPSSNASEICSASASWLSSPRGKSPARYVRAFASASSDGPASAYPRIFSRATSTSSRSVSFLVNDENSDSPPCRFIASRLASLYLSPRSTRIASTSSEVNPPPSAVFATTASKKRGDPRAIPGETIRTCACVESGLCRTRARSPTSRESSRKSSAVGRASLGQGICASRSRARSTSWGTGRSPTTASTPPRGRNRVAWKARQSSRPNVSTSRRYPCTGWP